MTNHTKKSNLLKRSKIHAALSEPARLAIADDLVNSDRSPKELSERMGIGTNLLAHHLDVLEDAGVISRTTSTGDGRKKYVRLNSQIAHDFHLLGEQPQGQLLFLCSHNSARSQLAAALWTAHTGMPATSAGTDPAPHIHRGAKAAAERIGLSLENKSPHMLTKIPANTQVITVCDLVHEELQPKRHWWHWSLPDPVNTGTASAFNATVDELVLRINSIIRVLPQQKANKK